MAHDRTARIEGDGALKGLRWWVLRDPPARGALNMAWDQVLAEALPPAQAVLRLYEWTRPTVSFGRNESARGRYRLDPSYDFVRRPTGGRAVVHREELTYAVVFPAARGLRAAYVEIHEALRLALAALGVAGRLAQEAGPISPARAGSCFERPVGGEVMVDTAKLVGSAQARIGRAILQHGSLLRVDDQRSLARLAREAAQPQGSALSTPSGATTLEAVLGRAPGMGALRSVVEGAFADRFGPLEEFDVGPLRAAAAKAAERYASEAWTWRR